MRVLTTVLLLLCLAALWYFVRNDSADYATFKLLTETADRQRRYIIWALRSFALFCGGTVLCLTILGRLHTLVIFPTEFSALASLTRILVPKHSFDNTGLIAGFIGALIGGLLIGIVIAKRSQKAKAQSVQPIYLGDIEPLMPRNWPETGCTALLSLNAGLSEELFFRLLLPLLITLLTGNTIAAFAASVVIFGFVHIYQGAVGVVSTTLLGLIFTAVYLWTGSIWIAAAGHACLDLVGLVIRPSLTRVFAARSTK